VSKPSFVVPVADLEDGPKTVVWTLSLGWLRQVLAGTEATPVRDGEATLEFSLNGREVVVRGRARVDVTMPCARTLDPVDISIAPEIFLLLEPLGQARARPTPHRGRGQRPGRSAPKGPRPGRSAEHDIAGWSSDPTLTDAESARDTYAGDQVVLDSFLREFVLLELPMVPLRSDLRSAEVAAIGGALSTAAAPEDPPVDARLAPLAAIASRLRSSKE
jgi:uncharacterized metal-binding protein YceD (DUF177 family)